MKKLVIMISTLLLLVGCVKTPASYGTVDAKFGSASVAKLLSRSVTGTPDPLSTSKFATMLAMKDGTAHTSVIATRTYLVWDQNAQQYIESPGMRHVDEYTLYTQVDNVDLSSAKFFQPDFNVFIIPQQEGSTSYATAIAWNGFVIDLLIDGKYYRWVIVPEGWTVPYDWNVGIEPDVLSLRALPNGTSTPLNLGDNASAGNALDVGHQEGDVDHPFVSVIPLEKSASLSLPWNEPERKVTFYFEFQNAINVVGTDPSTWLRAYFE